jgi:GT2 family glycosyltransferase
MGARPRVSVLIPTRDNVDELFCCLESLRRLAYPLDRLQVLIFDNGSTDSTDARVNARYGSGAAAGWGRLDVERSPRNLGAFGGRAAALRALDPEAEFILSLDDDVEVEPDALECLLEALASPRVGVAGARIVFWDAPGTTASGAGYFSPWLGLYRERRPAARTRCDFVTTCGCLIRRRALEAVGGFDRDYFTSHGDVDLCLKIGASGWEVVWEPAAVIRHRVARGGTRSPERVYYGYRNKLLLLRKHVPRWWLPVVLALYAAVWIPKILGGSLVHHRGLDRAEVRAILLAALDAARDRRGEAGWFGR